MSAINLEKSIERLSVCYIGKIKGIHTLDRTKLGDLEFDFAMFRVNLALKNKELTEKELYKKLRSENESKNHNGFVLGFLRRAYLYFFQSKPRLPQLPRKC